MNLYDDSEYIAYHNDDATSTGSMLGLWCGMGIAFAALALLGCRVNDVANKQEGTADDK